MEAKELRIGNLVHRLDLGTKQKRIESILEISERLTVTGPIKVICNYDEIFPIPITEEWLLKLGFELKYEDEDDNSIYFLNNFEITKDIFENIFWIDANIITPDRIEYIHKVQNIYFALTGKELTVSS